MKTTKFFTPFVLFLLAICGSGNLSAQSEPAPVMRPGHPWHYETNAGDTQTIEMVHVSTVPEGIGVPTDSVFKHTSLDVSWDQWWWCGAISFQTDAVTITEQTKMLKMKVYSEELTKYYIIAKHVNEIVDGVPNETTIITVENYPIDPGKWNTIEVDLSTFVGQNIAKFELVPGMPSQTIYFYPYFENPSPKIEVAEVVAPLVDNMEETAFTFSTNTFLDEAKTDPTSVVSIVDTTGLNVPVSVQDKVFKIQSKDIAGWQFYWNAMITLNDAIPVPTDEDVVLVAQVKSINNQVIIMQFADEGTLLNTAYNWGTRNIIPDEWNEIVMDYTSPSRGWTVLKRIEMANFLPNIDIYAYFYWAKKEGGKSSVGKVESAKKNYRIVDDRIFVDGAVDIKQYTVHGKLVNTSNTGAVPAMQGLNIIVADGVAYKVLYSGK